MKLKKPRRVDMNRRVKMINLPEIMSQDLAELLGIHFGDGSISVGAKKKYAIAYSLNIKEKELSLITQRFFKNCFDVELKEAIYPKKNCRELRFHSKMICYFLKENFNVPFGKKNDLRIPPIVRKNELHLKLFLRGLFNTDGCEFIKNDRQYKYRIIKITTKCEKFAKDIMNSLVDLGFRARINSKREKNKVYDVVLHGEKQANKWHNEIMNR